jgi:glycerol kinase
MQLQADLADVVVERPADVESTGRGAALLAGLGAGIVKSVPELEHMVSIARRFEPHMGAEERARELSQWSNALRRARSSQ